MIVKHHMSGWEIVSQYTHGLIAGKLAGMLDHSLRPKYWTDTLAAIIDHDEHLLNFGEKNYLTEVGAPKNFTMEARSTDESLKHAETLYNNAIQKSQWVALLISKHLEFLYKDIVEEQKHQGFTDFFAELEKKGKVQRKLYDVAKKEVDEIYKSLLFCDRCSLILCQGLIPELGRKLEINKTIGNKTYYIFEKENGDLTVEPWCFESESFQIHFESRILNQLLFKDNSELESALEQAEIFLNSLSFGKKEL